MIRCIDAYLHSNVSEIRQLAEGIPDTDDHEDVPASQASSEDESEDFDPDSTTDEDSDDGHGGSGDGEQGIYPAAGEATDAESVERRTEQEEVAVDGLSLAKDVDADENGEVDTCVHEQAGDARTIRDDQNMETAREVSSQFV